ncbi:acyl-CoA dehydrogenase family protein [Bacillus sp. FSL R5-0654]|uniref:acyl-CoA dehydrogenase family protein n=1 Tax=Bacillus TaxID=1386 RepID=UPI002880017C|nr:acyl-CoA dehydrogenase family protein [Bacillus sp. SG20001]WNF51269.1 acyl-CoA dehydrogenase family protein [Bacillus sp. SG20001]
MKINEKEYLIDKAWKIRDLLVGESEEIDLYNKFPVKGLDFLKENKFMSLLIPKEYNGDEFSIKEISEVAQILGSGCLSTSMIWGMHCQQVMTLVKYTDNESKKAILNEIVKEQLYIASVTSEYGKGGHLLTSHSPLNWISKDEFYMNRDAPTVTGGAYADAYLITSKAYEDGLDSEVSLIYALRTALKISQVSNWNAMGMKGTQSTAIHIGGLLKDKNIVTTVKFEEVAQYTLIPMAHIMWVSSWLGAAKNSFKQLIKAFRKNKSMKKYNSDIMIYRLSEIRLLLDTVDIYLNHVVDVYEKNHNNKQLDILCSRTFNIHLNNLKIIGSENLFKAVDNLIEVAGLYHGYLKNSETTLERTFRDLRAASLMYHNDRLKIANGKMSLFDSNLLPHRLS